MIKEIKCKTILTKTKLPGCDYVINPYRGCMMGCVYCYARFTKRFSNHSEKWGTYVDVKINSVEVLKEQIKKTKKGIVFLSSVTDAYQPIERKYQLTRKILEVLLKHQFPVSILTKSSLVLRDLDLFKKFEDIVVGMTITSLGNSIKNFEPLASLPEDRVKTLKTLHDNGIKTYAHVGPILPYFTDLKKIFSALEGVVDEIWLESFNTTGDNWSGVEQVLKSKFPEMLPKYKEIFFTNKKESYITDLKNEISQLSKQHKIKTQFFIHGE